jgi:uncharacterized protein YndB with AHSA1/START domain
MMNTIFNRDLTQKKVFVTREFTAPVATVWRAWTDPEILDQWWAPEPWKAVTVKMDFRAGGMWLYYMLGPDGTKSYCLADYNAVTNLKNYRSMDAFCDEHGVINDAFPRMDWNVSFNASGNNTKVDIEITYATAEDLLKIAELGFQEGFTMAHGNLDRLLEKQLVK